MLSGRTGIENQKDMILNDHFSHLLEKKLHKVILASSTVAKPTSSLNFGEPFDTFWIYFPTSKNINAGNE